ncbi:MAG: MXAN_5808 family serine peptidase [Myxococcaceae bacterium]
MPRIIRRVLVVAVLLAAWALVGSDRAPIWIKANEAAAASARANSFVAAADTAPRSSVDKPPHDLSSLKIFTKVILYVKDNYVDPRRVHPKEMMVQSLEYVEKAVPDVLVDGNADTGKLRVDVNGKSKTFDISHVDSLWKMSFTLKDVFDYISKNMRPMEDTRDIEYAAVNGMLSTLDPHSVLLRPEMYREMKLTTKGEFGGLGFVIQMKEGNLTVVKVLPKTPAYKAGIKKDDHISKIGEESTVNMDLNEAVSKLRGPVDSKVSITVSRKGWDKPQVMQLARAMIAIESVQSKLLAQGVGYVRLKNFQGNTTRDLHAALDEMSQAAGGKLKGLVLDLRGNPGGLLDQAIQVSDTFVKEGTIVATVGLSDKLREEKKAHDDEGDEAYPVAVLVNSGSASASEIVAGALKNLNRATIIGRQTFGKGSVQVLYDFPDDSALKLTIAKYLTPGDVSIQEVGIIPDIELIPTRVTKDRVDVFAPRKSVGEADLEHHFSNPSSAQAAKKREDVLGREKPAESLKYLKEDAKQMDASARQMKEEEGKTPKLSAKDKGGKGAEKTGKGTGHDPLLDVDTGGNTEDLDDQLDAESQDEVKEDFEVQFARDFVLKSPSVHRDEALKIGKPFIQERRKAEEDRIDGAIAGLGIDWAPGPTPKKVDLAAQLKPNVGQKVTAGDLMDMELTVENKGAEPLYRISAWTESDNVYVDRREFLFGKLMPGEKKSWSVPVRLPKDLTSRRDDITVKFNDDQGPLPETVVSEVNFVELPRPLFGFSWQVIDNCKECNGDGIVQRGETVDLVLDVTNRGDGKSLESFAQIKNGGDQNIFIEKGRFKIGTLDPNETKQARFSLSVKPGWKGETFPIKIAIVDEPLEEFSTEKLDIPVLDTGATVEPKKNVVKLSDNVALFPSATDAGGPIAKVTHASVFNQVGAVGDFVKLEAGEDRVLFAHTSDVKDAKGQKPTGMKDVQFLALRDPPEISVGVDPSQGGLVADGDHYALNGTVTSNKALLDIYVLVNDQKVFFKAASDAQATGPGEPIKVKFQTDVPLKEGNNNILIVARESADFASRKSLVIRRRPAAIAQKLANPK